jgi:hypothetical protein
MKSLSPRLAPLFHPRKHATLLRLRPCRHLGCSQVTPRQARPRGPAGPGHKHGVVGPIAFAAGAFERAARLADARQASPQPNARAARLRWDHPGRPANDFPVPEGCALWPTGLRFVSARVPQRPSACTVCLGVAAWRCRLPPDRVILFPFPAWLLQSRGRGGLACVRVVAHTRVPLSAPSPPPPSTTWVCTLAGGWGLKLRRLRSTPAFLH